VKIHRIKSERDARTNNDKLGYTVKLTFSEPVKGPISLGASSHFGLGLFLPIMDLEAAQVNEGDSAASTRKRLKL
jgi:hypothetical protein